MQVYAVQFHLFVTCVLFLSREGFRRACMRAELRCILMLTGAVLSTSSTTIYSIFQFVMLICNFFVAVFQL